VDVLPDLLVVDVPELVEDVVAERVEGVFSSYLPDSSPLASGTRAMIPTPARRSDQARSASIVNASGTCGSARRPILVATVSPASGRSARSLPMSVSLRPSP
jgi:hypothetical protein